MFCLSVAGAFHASASTWDDFMGFTSHFDLVGYSD